MPLRGGNAPEALALSRVRDFPRTRILPRNVVSYIFKILQEAKMALTPEAIQRMAELREKSRNNTLTMEELKESIEMLRGDRIAAHGASATSKARTATAKAKKGPIDSNDLLSELDGL